MNTPFRSTFKGDDPNNLNDTSKREMKIIPNNPLFRFVASRPRQVHDRSNLLDKIPTNPYALPSAASTTHPVIAERFVALLRPGAMISREERTSTKCYTAQIHGDNRQKHILRTHSSWGAEATQLFGHKRPAMVGYSEGSGLSEKNLLGPNITAVRDTTSYSPRSQTFIHLESIIRNQTSALVQESSVCRTSSLAVVFDLAQVLEAARIEASKFSKHVSSLGEKIEERSQVNKRLRAKIKAFLNAAERIGSFIAVFGTAYQQE
ncbi:unnamed protein product [Calicophoron daubneyi]|uniref:Uncharacterized protein n=1 Tax=Calicophoron daubneyi TaxID=300641 RepID=A0AAV2TH19_CALDB